MFSHICIASFSFLFYISFLLDYCRYTLQNYIFHQKTQRQKKKKGEKMNE